MLEQGKEFLLNDNKKYVVVFCVKINQKDYAFLIDVNDYLNTMICEYNNKNQFKEVTDINIISKFMKLFLKYKEGNK